MAINCKELHKILDSKHGIALFSYKDGKLNVSKNGKQLNEDYLAENWESLLPKNGVYIMFEKGETGHGINRIVRIGINSTQDDRLMKRVKSHLIGNSKSIFRKHVGEALAKKNGVPATKDEISTYIQNNISFVLVNVEDENKRKALETMLISTVAKCDECMPSDGWLGKYAHNNKISNGKLWNVIGLKAEPLTEEAKQWIIDGIVMTCDLSKHFAD